MANQRPIAANVVIIGAAAIAVVVVLLGVLNWDTLLGQKPSDNPPVTMSQPAAPPSASTAASSPKSPPAPSTEAPAAPPVPKTAAVDASAPQTKAVPPQDNAAADKTVTNSIVPSFDIVRVEPNGDSVIAGRSAPGATIELLRNDQVHARSVADNSGLFAFTPPPLPTGSHKIVLQSIAPDGKRERSKESVTVEINGATRPLVALVAPDKPTVLLSNPEPPAPRTAEATPPPASPARTASAAPDAATPANGPRAEIKIVTVESDEGKLYVSGEAAPGATVRLYLNDSFIAPGGSGGDGKLSFSIASGVKPGEYRVRLDDVDPVSGRVKSRAEVGYSVPVMVAEAPRRPAAGSPPGDLPQPSGTVPTDNGSTLRVASAPGGEVPSNTVVIPSIDTAIVSKGDSLWRISQRIYGRGYRYTVIYGANQTQIRNPDLIYPGQIFVLPNGDERSTSAD